ncbi:MAG: hypothetical protein Q9M26_00735 [Mariprofundales bacterium]|nr:hypothetical protein [Mariprofundales bacterium]
MESILEAEMFRYRSFFIALIVMVAGCVSQPLHLVNAMGDDHACQPQPRNGLWGKVMPNHVSDACVQKLTQAGFVPRDAAGMVNIRLAMEDGQVTVRDFPSGVLLRQPNLMAGDTLLSIDEQRPDSLQSADAMLFGTKGSEVSLLFGRGELRFPLKMSRLPLVDATLAPGLPKVVPLHTDGGETASSNGGSMAKSVLAQSQTPSPIPVAAAMAPNIADGYAQADTAQPNTAPVFATPALPVRPLIVAGDQICHLRDPFIDVGRVQEVRGSQVLVTMDHIQLASVPYTDFYHVNTRPQWSALAQWHPCSGSSPVFMALPTMKRNGHPH